MNEKVMNKVNYGLGTFFVFILSVGFIIQFFHSDNVFSDKENRSLEKKPSFTMEEYANTAFQQKYATYKNDQFFARSYWVELKTDLEAKIGMKKVRDVYIGKDNMLIQDFKILSKENSEKQIDLISKFMDKYQNFNYSFMLVPNKISVYKDSLAKDAPVLDQQKYVNHYLNALPTKMKKPNLEETFKNHKKESLFYMSDHHWTTLAAKYAFDAYIASEGREVKNIDYEKRISNNDFVGTLANKTGYYKEKDSIYLYLPKNDDTKVMVTYNDIKKMVPSLYDTSKQFSNDAYDVFLGGNHPLVEIQTNSTEDRRLLLLKDSYANCFIPFLTPYYSEITVVDPRYYYDDLDKLIEEKDITDVLFLYSANTLFMDTSLSSLLE